MSANTPPCMNLIHRSRAASQRAESNQRVFEMSKPSQNDFMMFFDVREEHIIGRHFLVHTFLNASSILLT
jgi:hypothetical protein